MADTRDVVVSQLVDRLPSGWRMRIEQEEDGLCLTWTRPGTVRSSAICRLSDLAIDTMRGGPEGIVRAVERYVSKSFAELDAQTPKRPAP